MQDSNEQGPTELARFLKETMRERRLSLVALARGSGISKQSLMMYMKGNRPNLESCRKLAAFLHIPLTKIVSLIYPDVDEQLVKSLLEIYLALPEAGQQLIEEHAMIVQRVMKKLPEYPE
jgi:transcriptional regulator with XRE-family HTH domain